MRTFSGVAAAAVLALTVVGIQSGGSQAAAPDRPAAGAVRALLAHPRAALPSDGTTYQVAGRVTDADGTTHVRLDRTYRGLPVLGGDLVVHQGPQAGWRGVSQTLDSAVRLSTTPSVTATRASSTALAPARANRGITGSRKAQSTRLVVDATTGTSRLAWEVVTGGVQ